MGAEAKTESNEKVTFYNKWCKRCGICVAFCPRSALAYNEEGYPYLVDPEACESCGLCEILCPDYAATVPARHEERATPAASGDAL
ncbi:MAG: 4Fe-4S binding protein [Chloroflexi bacterium]|nr:4Fe-4S binding protein [Chloroflexota bacterium]